MCITGVLPPGYSHQSLVDSRSCVVGVWACCVDVEEKECNLWGLGFNWTLFVRVVVSVERCESVYNGTEPLNCTLNFSQNAQPLTSRLSTP